MARGRWEEGGPCCRQAIDSSVVVPAWYHETLALALYLGGDLQRARDEAALGTGNCCSGYATLALTEAALGHVAAAHRHSTRPCGASRSSRAIRSRSGPTSRPPPR